MNYDNLVLHIPHSSAEGLDDSGWPMTDAFRTIVNRWTDWATDSLFTVSSYDSVYDRVRAVIFPISRFVVDVERLPDDPLEKKGQGIVYHQFDEFHRAVSPEEKTRLLDIYHSHHSRVASLLTPESLLIDCHSFPSHLSDIDVCIGCNDDWSCPPPEVIDLVVGTFKQAGYKVAINIPYSNSVTPPCAFRYHSVMIELNKRTYWDETLLQTTPNAAKLHALIIDLYKKLLHKPN